MKWLNISLGFLFTTLLLGLLNVSYASAVETAEKIPVPIVVDSVHIKTRPSGINQNSCNFKPALEYNKDLNIQSIFNDDDSTYYWDDLYYYNGTHKNNVEEIVNYYRNNPNNDVSIIQTYSPATEGQNVNDVTTYGLQFLIFDTLEGSTQINITDETVSGTRPDRYFYRTTNTYKEISIAYEEVSEGQCELILRGAKDLYGIMGFTTGSTAWSFLFSESSIIYPDNYDGDEIPSNSDLNNGDDGFIRYDLSFDYEVSKTTGISVTNTTSDELTSNLVGLWNCYFIISKADDFDNPIEEDIFYLNDCSDRTEILYNPPVVVGTEYIITLWLSHDAYGPYTYVSQRLKVTDADYTGGTDRGDDISKLERCFTDTAPWVDIIGCYKTLAYTINILTFGSINVTGIFDWKFDPQCRQLTTIGDWLNMDNNNRYVCPAVKEEVRNTVTPFITIFLGTILISFVVRSVSPNNPHHFKE